MEELFDRECDQVAIPVRAYPALMKRLKKKGRAILTDKSDIACTIVLDKDGYPHREDKPEQYVRLINTSLLDVMHTMQIFEENGKKAKTKEEGESEQAEEVSAGLLELVKCISRVER